jgi:hypothetical protein
MKRYFYHFPVLFFVAFLIAACDNEDEVELQKEQIVGAWLLASMTVDGQPANIAGSIDLIQFQSSSVFKRYYMETDKSSVGGWSIEGGMLNISLDLPVAYYIEELTVSALSLKAVEFDAAGSLVTTVKKYDKAENSLLP